MAGLAPRRTGLTLAGSGGVLFGIGFAHLLTMPGPVYPWLLPAYWMVRKRALPAYVLIAIAGFSLGSMRGAVYVRQSDIYAKSYGQAVYAVATAQDDAVYGSHSQLAFTGGNVELDGRKLDGKLQVSGF